MTADDAGEDPFAIPDRPQRRFPRRGGVEYDGGTLFALVPDPAIEDEALRGLLEGVLAGAPYTYGDWFDLPMPLYLVHDEETGDVFRVSVRDGRVRLHVLPATEPPGLERLYDRLRAATDAGWTVERRTE
ncbi:MAG: hypothetical protein ABEJ30_02270 [Halorientalis sp.]